MSEVPLLVTAPALLVTAPPWPVLSVEGPDSATWLNGIVTCDTTAVSAESGGWGLLLGKTGKIQAELQLVGRSDRLFVAVSGGDAAAVSDLLEHYLVMEDAELRPAPEVRFVCVFGTHAAERAAAFAPSPSAMPWAGGEGAAFAVLESELSAVLDQARLQGARIEVELPAATRVALGLPSYGVDFGQKDNPHEASLDRRAVSWSKGCYLGQEVVCMQDMRGRVKRRLARLEGHDVPWQNGSDVVCEDQTHVGLVTTVAGGQAIASLSAPWFEPGRELYVLGRPVRVLPLSGQ